MLKRGSGEREEEKKERKKRERERENETTNEPASPQVTTVPSLLLAAKA